jgi:hypothetical protein
VSEPLPALDEQDPGPDDGELTAAERKARDEALSDLLADEITAGIAALCASRADLAAAVVAVVRADYL